MNSVFSKDSLAKLKSRKSDETSEDSARTDSVARSRKFSWRNLAKVLKIRQMRIAKKMREFLTTKQPPTPPRDDESTILYAAYGADRDPKMLEHIIGAKPTPVADGTTVFIEDYELVIQTAHNVPELRWNGAEYSHKDELRRAWGKNYENFRTYNIRPAAGKRVAAKLYSLTETQHNLVRDWENWFEPILVKVRLSNDELILARTEGLWKDQAFHETVDGENYPTYIVDKKLIWRVANASRNGE